VRTTSSYTIELVQTLVSLIEQRKESEKLERMLKDQIREIMGRELILEAGKFCVTISERTRRDLDKEAISHDMGQDFLAKYTKHSAYEIIEVKPVRRSAGVSNE